MEPWATICISYNQQLLSLCEASLAPVQSFNVIYNINPTKEIQVLSTHYFAFTPWSVTQNVLPLKLRNKHRPFPYEVEIWSLEFIHILNVPIDICISLSKIQILYYFIAKGNDRLNWCNFQYKYRLWKCGYRSLWLREFQARGVRKVTTGITGLLQSIIKLLHLLLIQHRYTVRTFITLSRIGFGSGCLASGRCTICIPWTTAESPFLLYWLNLILDILPWESFVAWSWPHPESIVDIFLYFRITMIHRKGRVWYNPEMWSADGMKAIAKPKNISLWYLSSNNVNSAMEIYTAKL